MIPPQPSSRADASEDTGLRLSDLDYPLPDELIAQQPTPDRADSRLLVYERASGAVRHSRTRDLPSALREPSLLVLNDTRVLRARLRAHRPTGGRVDLLVLDPHHPDGVLALARPARRLKEGETLSVRGAPDVRVARHLGQGRCVLEVPAGPSALLEAGTMPLPPYIRRDPDGDPRDTADFERYQTVYARRDGAVAAPTAGLHFTPELLEELQELDHKIAFVTLHVGPGTFAPIRKEIVSHHPMHEEVFEIPTATAAAHAEARAGGRPVVAVGTTSLRALEASFDGRRLRAGAGSTDIFIYPPYKVRSADQLMTNFHIPRSSLLALVAALMGLEELKKTYALAIEQRYRFYSYGDAMLIL